MGVVLEEVDDVPPARVVLGMREHGGRVRGPCERDAQDVANRRFRAVGHQDQPVRQIERLVDVVGHHHHGPAGFLPDAQQDVLQLESRQRIEL